MDLTTAEQVVLDATRQAKVAGGLGWIAEGRPLRGRHLPHMVLGALAVLSNDSRYGAKAEPALRAYTKVAVVSAINPSADLLGVERVTPPSDYRHALTTLSARCRGGSLAHIDAASVSAAQKDDPHVMDALCAVVGLSLRELADRAAPNKLATSATSTWTPAQITAAFTVMDEIVCGKGRAQIPGGKAARPVELLLADKTAPKGWSAVEQMRTDGVPYEILLTQRAVGGGWNAHRGSTAQVLPALLRDQAHRVLTDAGLDAWQLGKGADKKFLAERIAVSGSDIGQVALVAHRGGTPLLAVAVSVANDGGTARRSGGNLQDLPSKINVPVALVLAGPGWAERGESTALVSAFGGRVFTDQSIAQLADLDELVSTTGNTAVTRSPLAAFEEKKS